MIMFEHESPLRATLANWVPKCNAEMETRLRLNFEIPLDEEIIAGLPDPLKRLAAAVGKLDDGLTEGTLSTEYEQSLEFYEAPGTDVVMRLEDAQLQGLHIFRPTPKEGPVNDLFLVFSTTVRAEGGFGDQLATWALRHIRRTVFMRGYVAQGRLPLESQQGSLTLEPAETAAA
jgi:hypothetical protein